MTALASEEIRQIAIVLEGYAVHLGVTDFHALARVTHAKIPQAGIASGLTAAAATRRACEKTCQRMEREELRDPANYMLRVFVSLATDGDQGPARGSQPSTGRASSPSAGPDSEFIQATIRDIEDAERHLFRDQERNRRVAAIEAWRRNPETVPCPHWALYGRPSPGSRAQQTLQPQRTAEPRRRMPTFGEPASGAHGLAPMSRLALGEINRVCEDNARADDAPHNPMDLERLREAAEDAKS